MKRVLVIGDGCKDVFQYGECERLSPEAPVPVFKPIKSKNNGGMAINVYANVLALGVYCDIITDSGITKTRYVDELSNQMLLRVDENDKIKPITSEDIEAIGFNEYDAVIISDYNKGFLTYKDIEYIAYNHPLVFMDTKKTLDIWCLNVDFIKINEKEFNQNKDFCEEYSNMLIVTLGNRGAMFNSQIFPIEDEHEVRDLSGAGDTFLAAFVVKYLENRNIPDAIKFANKCASWVVTQKGVVVVDLNKINL